MLKVYLAGPEVFLPNAIEIGRRKKELCKSYKFEGLFPFDNEIKPRTKTEKVDQLIYRANERMIHRADFGIFNLTPFRGPSADAGTVFELGLMTGLGKRVFGYTNVFENYWNRVEVFSPLKRDTQANVWRDANEMSVEEFGNVDNLMIDWAVSERGGLPIIKPTRPVSDLYRDFEAFENCLRLAVQAMSKTA